MIYLLKVKLYYVSLFSCLFDNQILFPFLLEMSDLEVIEDDMWI